MAKLKIKRNYKWYAYNEKNEKFFASDCEYYVEKEITDYFNNNRAECVFKSFDIYKVVFDMNDEIKNKIKVLNIKFNDYDIIINGDDDDLDNK